jgi:predicted phosphodiesterase
MRTLALSDLHLGRCSSRLRRAEDLIPLVEGFQRVLLLGDIVDEWYLPAGSGETRLAEIKEACAKAGAKEVIHCRGNHDANSGESEEFIEFGPVVYLHGHAVYHRLRGHGTIVERMYMLNARKFSPARAGSRMSKRRWRWLEGSLGRFPALLLVPLAWRWSVRRRILELAHEIAPDGRLRAMVLGHSHCPGHRRLGKLHVFNLGSWMRNARGCGFHHEDGQGLLVRIETGTGGPRWGRVLHRIPL